MIMNALVEKYAEIMTKINKLKEKTISEFIDSFPKERLDRLTNQEFIVNVLILEMDKNFNLTKEDMEVLEEVAYSDVNTTSACLEEHMRIEEIGSLSELKTNIEGRREAVEFLLETGIPFEEGKVELMELLLSLYQAMAHTLYYEIERNLG